MIFAELSEVRILRRVPKVMEAQKVAKQLKQVT